MIKLSRQTKEIIKTILFFAIIALLVATYVVYPLNRTKVLMARADIDDHNPDSLDVNDVTKYISQGLAVDTFRFESDGLTNLACLALPADGDSLDPPLGTVFLLHADNETRDNLATLAARLHQSRFVVIAYDQRASGRSTGNYRGDGSHEATDVEELISHLEIRDQIVHPLYLIGFNLGGDAAILAAHEEDRIDAVVAVSPYLTTVRMQDVLRERYQTFWFPFYRTMMWWWYEIRSGYATMYRRRDDIRPVSCPSLLLLPRDWIESKDVARLKEISPPQWLQIAPLPDDENALYNAILPYLKALPSR